MALTRTLPPADLGLVGTGASRAQVAASNTGMPVGSDLLSKTRAILAARMGLKTPPITPITPQQQSQVQQWQQNPIDYQGRQATAAMLKFPEGLRSIPGFSNMTLQGANRMSNIREQGLSSMLSAFGAASDRERATQEKLAAEKQKQVDEANKNLATRRQNAIKEYMDFKQKIIGEGATPDLKAGQDLINAIQQSDNPEVELSNYFSTAAPFVKKLFAPKGKGGGTVTIGGIPVLTTDMKRKAFALGYTAEQIANPSADLYASVFKGERTMPGSTIVDVFKRMLGGTEPLTPSKKVSLSPEKAAPTLTMNQILKEAQAKLEEYEVDSPEWNSIRDQIIEQYPALESFL